MNRLLFAFPLLFAAAASATSPPACGEVAARATVAAHATSRDIAAAAAGDNADAQTLPAAAPAGELLENGIRLPERWPPHVAMNYAPMPLPYLERPPEVIPIDRGRQLFVDRFLIESTDLERRPHRPQKVAINPVLKPETPLEMGRYGNPGASAKDGGVWWDPQEGLFKMWYEAGWLQTMAYATSRDGIRWERPALDVVPGTNQVVEDLIADSSTVFLDHDAENPDERFKMFLRPPNSVPGSAERFDRGYCMTSPDGIHWSAPIETGPCGDRSTVFYNPFRRKWVFSLRNSGDVGKVPIGRYRNYHEHDDFMQGARWTRDELHFWLGADSLDDADPYIGDAPQLYNLSAVAYESLMIALPQIHLGPSNGECRRRGVPKITELKVAYSRDGFHWDRTDRETFIAAERKAGCWDRGYVQSVGGLCVVVGDRLWFYYIGFRGGDSRDRVYERNGMHYGGSTGMAVLRRDGFVSLGAGARTGEVVTRPVCFSGERLFVNADCPAGELRAEVLDADGRVIPGFSAAECRPLHTDSTIAEVRWRRGGSLAALRGRAVRFRFTLRNGDLYAFWVSPDRSGRSGGYNAAGGPGFTGGTDTEGLRAYRAAARYPDLLKKCNLND